MRTKIRWNERDRTIKDDTSIVDNFLTINGVCKPVAVWDREKKIETNKKEIKIFEQAMSSNDFPDGLGYYGDCVKELYKEIDFLEKELVQIATCNTCAIPRIPWPCNDCIR